MDLELTNSLSNPPPLADGERRLVDSLIRSIAPLEYEILGPAKVQEIIHKRKFETPQTGRHLELMEVINGLASIAGLVQCAIVTVVWVRKRLTDKAAEAASLKQQARAALEQHIRKNPELAKLVAEQPGIVESVVDAVERSQPSSPAK